MPINPFIHGTPATGTNFTDREELQARLNREIGRRGQRILLYGRRRMGKTSLIDHVGTKAAAFFRADLSFAATPHDIADALLVQKDPRSGSRWEKLWDLVKRHVGPLTISAHEVRLSAELRQVKPEGGVEALAHLFDAFEAWAAVEDIPATIVLDEFQEVRRIVGERAEWRLRAATQNHRHVTYLFSGSDHRLVTWMSEPNAAFYKQIELIHVGPIDPAHFTRWLMERFRAGGLPIDSTTAEAIVGTAGPCSGDIVRLAKATFDLTAERQQAKKPAHASELVPAAFEFISLRELGDLHAKTWRSLTLAQTGVLRALAQSLPPTAGDTLRKFGIRAASTAHDALAVLTDNAILARDENGKLIFDSPFFRRWIEVGVPEI